MTETSNGSARYMFSGCDSSAHALVGRKNGHRSLGAWNRWPRSTNSRAIRKLARKVTGYGGSVLISGFQRVEYSWFVMAES